MSRHTRRLLLRAAVLAFFGVLFEWLDLFGVVEASHQASADAFARLTAPFYSDHIKSEPVVIVFDPTSLKAISQSHIWDDKDAPSSAREKAWPLSFKDQARFLRALSGYEPSAIFYDIFFFQNRDPEGLVDFAKAIREVTAAPEHFACDDSRNVPGTPVFLAKDAQRTPLPLLCAAGAQNVLTTWEAEANTYPMLACEQTEADFPCGGRREMAATRLWRDWCRQHKGEASCLDADKHDDTRSFALIWGAGPDPQGGIYRPADKPCRSAAAQVLHGPGGAHSDDPAVNCPFPLTIPAANIVLCDTSNSNGCESRQLLSDRLQGHVVIIAADFPGLHDMLPTPVHGLLPGAFTHAAALDNLMRFGTRRVLTARQDYFADNGENVVSLLKSFMLLFACVAGALWLLERIAHRTRPAAIMTEIAERGDRKLVHRLSVTFGDRVRWLRLAAYSPGPPDKSVRHASLSALGFLLLLFAAMMLVGLAIALTFFWWAVAPLNWIGLVVLVVTLCFDEIAGESTYAVLALTLFHPWGRRAARAFLDPPDKETEDEDIRDETVLEITHEET